MISALLHRAAVAPTYALGAPPLLLAVAIGLTAHHHRTRRTHR